MEHRDTRYWRCRHGYFWLGVVCTTVFALMGAGSFVVAFWNLDGSFEQPAQAAALFAVFWGSFLVLGIWMTLFALRYRLCLTGEGIGQSGCCFTKRLQWLEIERLRWRLWPAGGSVVLRGARGCIVVEFGILTEPDRREVIRHLREKLGQEIQEGWEPFERRWVSAAAPASSPGRFTGVALALLFLLMAGGFALLWKLKGGVYHLFLAALNLAAAVWFLYRRRGVKSEGETR